jgi:hypothetical protein
METQMKMHDPFYRTILGPAIRIGDAVLTLHNVERDYDTGRDRATFLLVTPEFKYQDRELQSGVGGGWSKVEIFETFLSFMEACAESREYVGADGNPGENANLFPQHVGEWLVDNTSAISEARSVICNEEGNPLKFLIQE